MTMPLTIKTIEAAKPKDKPYKLSDGASLYLNISTTGVKSWRCNYSKSGKQKTKTFGTYPEISLADARKANILFKDGASGKSSITFESVFNDWVKIKLPNLSNSKHQIQVVNTMTDHVLPFIGKLPIDSIPRKLLVEVVKKRIDTPETAKRIAGRIGEVFTYAMNSGLIESHGAAQLAAILPKPKVKHHPCIDPLETGLLLKNIYHYNEPVTKLGLLLIAHTFVRFNELQGMKWDELILDDHVWLIPGERMKMDVPHVVPLTKQAIAIIEELRQHSQSEFVMESPLRRGHCISENTLLFALYSLGYRGKMTVHGFRALASTVLNETFPDSADAIERQLAHSETDAVRGSYNRAQYLPRRRDLMAWWSDWLCRQYSDQCRTQASDSHDQ